MQGLSIRLPEPGGFLKRMLRGLSGGAWGRDDALAVIRHELRTPLTGILGMAALLRESGLDTEQLRFLTVLEQSGRQLADLLDRPGAWLATGMPNADHNADHNSEVSVDFRAAVSARTFNGLHLLEGMTRAHWPAARHQGLGIFLVFDHRLPAFWRTDPVLLREALDNLLTNAIKFTPRGGYVLLEARRFGVSDKAGAGIELRVSDTGMGIPRRDQRRIYSFGQRGSEAQAGQGTGSGYGLFICNCIAGALGGNLNHHRNRLGGTCFTMRLPGIVLPVPAAMERLRPGLLLGMSCQVSLPPPLDRVVGHVLRRMGIAVSFQKRANCEGRPESRHACIIDSVRRGRGLREGAQGEMDIPANRFPSVHCRAILLGRLDAISHCAHGSPPQEFSSVLNEPILHDNLEPLMLRFALHLRRNGQ